MCYKFIIAVAVLCIGLFVLTISLTIPHDKTGSEWIAPLSAEQKMCIQQLTDTENIFFAEIQSYNGDVALGYTTSEYIFATMLQLKSSNECVQVLQKRIETRRDILDRLYDPRFHAFKYIELTGDTNPEIYMHVTLDYRVQDRFLFFVKSENESYEELTSRVGCHNRSRIEFIDAPLNDRPNVRFTDDVRCVWTDGKQGYLIEEFYLTNDGIEQIRLEVVDELSE